MTRADGFTLVELLAAMVVGSLLLMSLAWATGTIGRESRLSEKDRQNEEVASLSANFVQLIGAGLPDGEGQPPFDVATDKLSGVIVPPAALGLSGPVEMTMYVRPEERGETLYLELSAKDPAKALPSEAGKPVKLLSGFKSIKFEEHPDGVGGPQLIGLELRGAEVHKLAAVTKVTSVGACRFDAIAGKCQ